MSGFSFGLGLNLGGGPQGGAPAAPAGHRYWRLLFDTINIPAGAPNVAEVEMRIAPGGADQCNGGTASSTATLSGTAANAFDNNAGLSWHGNIAVVPAWLKYDFGVGVAPAIIEVSIQAHTPNPAYTPDLFDIQWSDDNSIWTTEWSVTSGSTGYTANEIRVFTKP